MTVADILNSIKFVVDPKGQQYAVMVDRDVWEQIVTLLEDAEEIKKARSVNAETVPWKTAKKDLNLGE